MHTDSLQVARASKVNDDSESVCVTEGMVGLRMEMVKLEE